MSGTLRGRAVRQRAGSFLRRRIERKSSVDSIGTVRHHQETRWQLVEARTGHAGSPDSTQPHFLPVRSANKALRHPVPVLLWYRNNGHLPRVFRHGQEQKHFLLHLFRHGQKGTRALFRVFWYGQDRWRGSLRRVFGEWQAALCVLLQRQKYRADRSLHALAPLPHVFGKGLEVARMAKRMAEVFDMFRPGRDAGLDNSPAGFALTHLPVKAGGIDFAWARRSACPPGLGTLNGKEDMRVQSHSQRPGRQRRGAAACPYSGTSTGHPAKSMDFRLTPRPRGRNVEAGSSAITSNLRRPSGNRQSLTQRRRACGSVPRLGAACGGAPLRGPLAFRRTQRQRPFCCPGTEGRPSVTREHGPSLIVGGCPFSRARGASWGLHANPTCSVPAPLPARRQPKLPVDRSARTGVERVARPLRRCAPTAWSGHFHGVRMNCEGARGVTR